MDSYEPVQASSACHPPRESCLTPATEKKSAPNTGKAVKMKGAPSFRGCERCPPRASLRSVYYLICLIHSGKLSQCWFSNRILLAELNNSGNRKLAIMGVFRTLLNTVSRVLTFPDTEKCQTITPSGDVVRGTGAGDRPFPYPKREKSPQCRVQWCSPSYTCILGLHCCTGEVS